MTQAQRQVDLSGDMQMFPGYSQATVTQISVNPLDSLRTMVYDRWLAWHGRYHFGLLGILA